MKLARNTEWAILAGLIVYLAFLPQGRVIKDLLATPVGKAVGLVAIVAVWKYVSPLIAVLLTIGFLRCATWNIWEGFSGAEVACTCEDPNSTWDTTSKTCKNSSGTVTGAVKSCTCANGYAWDGGEKGTKQCIQATADQAPIPPATTPAAAALAAGLPPPAAGTGTSLGASAPATEGTPAPSAVPQTTGSAAAQTMAALPPVGSSTSGGVQPGAGTSSTAATV